MEILFPDNKEETDRATSSQEIEDDDPNLHHLQSQVFTLTQSLSTMSAEKAKMVATYQAEKKKLKVGVVFQLTKALLHTIVLC